MRWMPIMFVVVLTFTGCDRLAPAPVPGAAAPSTPAPSVLRVTTVKPTKTTLKRVTEQPGRVEPFEQAPLFSKVAGYVEKVHVDLGDKVEAGDMLVELSVPELRDELKQKLALHSQSQSEVVQAQAAIGAAEAQEETAKSGIAEAEAGIERIEALFARARDELQRIEQLAQMNAVTSKLVDEAKSTFRGADAGRREAAARVASAKTAAAGQRSLVQKSEADLAAAQARVQVADASVRQAQTMLAYAKIAAPFAGSIATRSIDVGHFIPAGSAKSAEPLLTLVNTKTVRVKVDVPEGEATFTRPDASATIRVQALPGGRFTGKVSRVSASLNEATRTLRAEIDVPNPEGRLIPGMYVTVSLTVAERPDVIVLPTSAIGGKSDPKPFCFVVESGKLTKRELTLGLEAAGQVEITSDLDPEMQVVKSINPALTEGQLVETVEPGK